MIEIKGIQKNFGKLEVLKGFDFSLPWGRLQLFWDRMAPVKPP